MILAKWWIASALNSNEKTEVQEQTCPKCGLDTCTETSGPLTDFEQCENCLIAFHPEEFVS